jgi:hypothetical protein
MSVLCKNVVSFLGDQINKLVDYLGESVAEKVKPYVNQVTSAIGGGIEFLNCHGGTPRSGSAGQSVFGKGVGKIRDFAGLLFYALRANDFWGNPQVGPKLMADGAKNGSQQMGVYAVSRETLDDESARRKVVLLNASAAKAIPVVEAPPSPVYNAKAEFYWDCNGTWDADACNGARPDEYPYALYGMKWRGRLVRASRPGDLARRAVDAAVQSNIPGPLKVGGWVDTLSTWLQDAIADASYH